MEDQPGEERRYPPQTYGRAADGPPGYEPPANGQLAYGPPEEPTFAPPDRPSTYGQPTYGQPVPGQPPYGRPTYGPPPSGQPTYGQPTYGQPGYGQPGGSPPVYGRAAGGSTTYGRPPEGPTTYGRGAAGRTPPPGPGGRRPSGGRGRRTTVIAIAGAAMVVLLLVVGGLVFLNRESPVAGATTAFLNGWKSGNLDGVALQGPNGAPLAGADVTKQIHDLSGDLVPGKADFTVSGDQSSDGTGTATVDVRWTLAEGLVWSYQTTVHLKQVDDAWIVVFSPDTVHPSLKEGQHLQTHLSAADRGSILDAAGEPLVKARPVVTVGIEPQKVTNQNSLIAALDAAFKSVQVPVDLADLPARIKAANPDAFVEVVTLRREVYDQIRNQIHDLPGTSFQEGTLQLAPTRSFARALIGTVGDVTKEQLDKNPGKYLIGEQIGQSGLQEEYDTLLRGVPGIKVVIPKGDGAKDLEVFTSAPKPGGALKTTLDQKVQNAADAALTGYPQNSALVAVRVSDGAILATANGPDGGAQNLAFTASVPPGSTFKVISALGLLDSGHVTPDTTVNCPKTFAVEGRTFTNASNFELGAVPFHVDFAKSCNTAFASLAPKLGQDGLRKAGASVGIGTTWGIGTDAFTGTVPANVSTVEAAAASFGQGQTLVSPLCLGAATAAIARGAWITPKLFTSMPAGAAAPVQGSAGNPPADGTKLKPESVSALTTMMREVVTAGTATTLADVPGAPVQVKTGTAEFNDNPADTHAWVVGWQGDVAFAVFVEKGGGSGDTALPIAEKFLRALA
jgi:cell division protein FtsI/penicillin-binding protein 2